MGSAAALVSLTSPSKVWERALLQFRRRRDDDPPQRAKSAVPCPVRDDAWSLAPAPAFGLPRHQHPHL